MVSTQMERNFLNDLLRGCRLMMFNGQSFVSTSDFLSHLEKTETRVFQAGFQEVDNLAIVTSG